MWLRHQKSKAETDSWTLFSTEILRFAHSDVGIKKKPPPQHRDLDSRMQVLDELLTGVPRAHWTFFLPFSYIFASPLRVVHALSTNHPIQAPISFSWEPHRPHRNLISAGSTWSLIQSMQLDPFFRTTAKWKVINTAQLELIFFISSWDCGSRDPWPWLTSAVDGFSGTIVWPAPPYSSLYWTPSSLSSPSIGALASVHDDPPDV